MDFPEAVDPWNTPDVHKNHNHPEPPRTNGAKSANPVVNGIGTYETAPAGLPPRTTSDFTTTTAGSGVGSGRPTGGAAGGAAGGGWGYFDGSPAAGGGFSESPNNNQATSPFGGAGGGREPSGPPPAPAPSRTIGSGRTGSAVEENVIVTLMPEKEGMFMFQHHNYEVTSSRRGSKVIRRYSDFVWLLDCLHKRFPFRVLPLLPPKRVAGELRDRKLCSDLEADHSLSLRLSQRQPSVERRCFH